MQDAPSAPLAELLDDLKLAGEDDFRQVQKLAQRLAPDLPLFDSVWLDALVQARRITPFQAREIGGGRGTELIVGPYVLVRPATGPAYAKVYQAKLRDGDATVRLLVANLPTEPAGELNRELPRVVERSRRVEGAGLQSIFGMGCVKNRLWCATEWRAGLTADQWILQQGRMPPRAVTDVARQMAATLARLEELQIVHGDVAAENLLITPDGQAVLLFPGIRRLLRPEEGYAQADLPPNGYDFLAPERIADSARAGIASDVYSAGLVWWHLLTGRVPFAGGNAMTKLRNVAEARLRPVEQLVQQVPAPLVAAIDRCTQVTPATRRPSFTTVCEILGPSTDADTTAFARATRRRTASLFATRAAASPMSGATKKTAAAAVAAVLLLAPLVWLVANYAQRPPTVSVTPAAPNAAPETVPNQDAKDDPKAASLPEVVEARPSRPAHNVAANVVTLPSTEPQYLKTLSLSAGQIVRGAGEKRATVVVPTGGLSIEVEDIRFERIDFVASQPSQSPSTVEPAAMLRLRAHRVQFNDCRFLGSSFATDQAQVSPPIAILLNPPKKSSPLGPRPVEIQMRDCVLHEVAAAVSGAIPRALSIRLKNTLLVSSGFLLRSSSEGPGLETLQLDLRQSTFRDVDGLVEFVGEVGPNPTATINIRATHSVFAPRGDRSLISFRAAASPAALLRRIRWEGEGSLLEPAAAMAAWRSSEGQATILDDSALAVDGLIRGNFKFNGEVEIDPVASQISRYSAPVRSSEPPGIRAVTPSEKTAVSE